MVDYSHLKIEDQGQIIICYLSNPPTHTLTSRGVLEIHDFLDSLSTNKDLRVLAFTGSGEDVFIKHYEVGELAETAEQNISKNDKRPLDSEENLKRNYMVFIKCYLKLGISMPL